MSAVDSGLQSASNLVLSKSPRGGLSKRAIDIVLALSVLLTFLPLMLFIAMLIRLEDRGPAFFGHERVGYNGRRFRCLKFRSMSVNAKELLEAHLLQNPAARQEWEFTQKLRDDPRITPLGRFLRTTSLDELPQLINVLRGDMSLVGPRPIVQAEMPRYADRITDYLCVRPGITGLWQVSGRSDVDYDRRVELDAQYVRNWSLRSDLFILFRTVFVVFSRSGSY
jgi:exopolysaccharide production protein ExoY